MTPAHRTEVVSTIDGELSLDRLPFRTGRAVEVIVLPLSGPAPAAHPLEGSILRHDRPTEPFADADWDSLQ